MTNRFYYSLACLSGTIYKPPFQGVAAAPLRMGLPADLGLCDKGTFLGLVVSAMVVNMSLAGTSEIAGIAVPFLIITALNLADAVSLLKNISPEPV